MTPSIPSRTVLKNAAQATHFKTLRKALVSFIDKATENELKVLNKFLDIPPEDDSVARSSVSQPAGPNKHHPLHCVRCHIEYTTKTNGKKACTVPHVFDTESATHHRFYGPGRSRDYAYSTLCCTKKNTRGKLPILIEHGCGNDEYKIEKIKPIYCFVGPHTADPHIVSYRPYSIVKCRNGDDGECTRKTPDVGEEPLWNHSGVESDDDMEGLSSDTDGSDDDSEGSDNDMEGSDA